jgi:hypothetical protein
MARRLKHSASPRPRTCSPFTSTVSSVWTNDLRSAAIAALLVEQGYEQLGRMGYRKLEVSWIPEDNLAMLGLIKLLGDEAYKRYRIYEKQLPSAP